jgi:lipopolysaccharide transport system ATP-binding protein
MSKTVIKIEDVSKMYRLGEVGTGTLTHDLQRTWAKLTGKPDPFAKVGVSNDREQKGGDYVWALRDINLEVKEGEILGIIGRNGAGKSTLLKLLSRVTAPTTGRILTKGRIASLLEVGTGFHPELTGRENIYLNGAILGMTRQEITKQLEEIVEFSGCAKYIDTPVKRYSSGMQVRLGFAVAAHLESEILIIDEVLAVGDYEFQKKCIDKINSVCEHGRSILFVSHNISMITQICHTAAYLNQGTIALHGNVQEVTEKYMSNKPSIPNFEWLPTDNKNPAFTYEKITIQKSGMVINSTIPSHQNFRIYFYFLVTIDNLYGRIAFHITNQYGIIIFASANTDNLISQKKKWKEGKYIEFCEIPGNLLLPGGYYLTVSQPSVNEEIIIENIFQFKIDEHGSLYSRDKRPGIILPLLKWGVEP